MEELIVDWLNGTDLDELGSTYLTLVNDETYRYEQLSEFISQVLEHLLPWLLNTVVSWVNEERDEAEQLCPELPAYIRYGVNSSIALELARSGVRSRRLVHAVADAAPDLEELTLREWLSASDLQTWQRMFSASPAELADLLFFTRASDVRITSRVLAGETVVLPLVVDESCEAVDPGGDATIREVAEAAPGRIAAYSGQQVAGYVRSEHHDDMSRLLAIGIPLIASITEQKSISIRTDDPTARETWFSDSEGNNFHSG